MRSWKDLEDSFEALQLSCHEADLDHQAGPEGERWEVCRSTPDCVERFTSLASIAGTKVLDLAAASDWPGVVEEKDAATRWYRCLQALSSSYRLALTGTSVGVGFEIFRVHHVCGASSSLCLKMESFATTPRRRLEALTVVPRYAGPAQKWRSAQGFLGASEPDLAQATADAASAVEALARIVLGKPKITLADAAKELRAKRGVHGALAEAIGKVYAYASDEDGIRHGASALPIKPDEAHFAIDVCEASLRLLLALDASP